MTPEIQASPVVGLWVCWRGARWCLSAFPRQVILSARYDGGFGSVETGSIEVSSHPDTLVERWAAATEWAIGPTPEELEHAMTRCAETLACAKRAAAEEPAP